MKNTLIHSLLLCLLWSQTASAVMSCCLMAENQAAVMEVLDSEPPCHESAAVNLVSNDPTTSDDCLDCSDCLQVTVASTNPWIIWAPLSLNEPGSDQSLLSHLSPPIPDPPQTTL